MKPEVTLAITSCGRMDLLEKTLESFFKYNRYPIYKTIIVDDSGGKFQKKRISKLIPGNYEFIINKKNIGQIKSIDKLYKKIKTPFIFHCEDDWEFYNSGFIEESLKVLKSNSKIFTVWLKAHNDTYGHPISSAVKYGKLKNYKLIEKNYKKIWHGFTFNPGLRRLDDYLILAPFTKQDILLPENNKSIINEADLSIKYEQLGFRSVISILPQGYVKHTGFAQHIPLETEKTLIKKLIVKFKNFIKLNLYR